MFGRNKIICIECKKVLKKKDFKIHFCDSDIFLCRNCIKKINEGLVRAEK